MSYDIFAELKQENDDFDQSGVWIVGKPEAGKEGMNKKGEKGGYWFSQKETLEAIDLAGASKYKKGIYDEENQRKTYINIVNFYRDVMKMKINIDVANYIFEPTSLDFVWPVWLLDKQFKAWSDEESYDDLIDEYADSLATYGSTVSKKLTDCADRVPLRALRCTQTAKSLYEAAMNGGFATIENDLHFNQMSEYPDWDTDGMSKNKSYQVFERYALVPKTLVDSWDTDAVDTTGEEMVLAQAILAPAVRGTKGAMGKILFMVELDEDSFPLEECHAERRDGRWLGIGQIEKQLENQLARNLSANLRRRGLLWATKKIFYTNDQDAAKNLLMEVHDGETMYVKNGGVYAQVNTANQHDGSITADENTWKENSQQISFAFEVATGESMPSGTPFRLGVVLQQSVAQHYALVRKTFSMFLKRSFFDQLVPIFQAEYSNEHTIHFPIGATDVDNLKDQMLTFALNDRIFNAVMAGKPVNPDAIKQKLMTEMQANPYLFVNVPKGFYKNIRWYMRLNLDDDISAELTTLSTLYQTMIARGDPRADTVLAQILAKSGKALPAIVGKLPAPAPQAPAPANGAPVAPAPNAPLPAALQPYETVVPKS